MIVQRKRSIHLAVFTAIVISLILANSSIPRYLFIMAFSFLLSNTGMLLFTYPQKRMLKLGTYLLILGIVIMVGGFMLG